MLFLGEFFVDLVFQKEDEVFPWYALDSSDVVKEQFDILIFECEAENAVVEL